MAEIEVLQQRTVASPRPDKAGQPATWVTYRVMPGGALDSVLIDGAAPSQADIQAAIRAQLQQRGQAGQRFTV